MFGIVSAQSLVRSLFCAAVVGLVGCGGSGSNDETPPIVDDGTPGAVTPSPTPTATPVDDEDDDPLSADPEERACQILERTNITITNIAEPIVHEPGEECPEEVRTLAVVGNIHPIGFEYTLTSDAPDAIEISPTTGTALQGQLNKHTGSYLCTRTASFVVNVTARVTRYLPADGVPITVDEAIALCGSGSDIGNTEETKQIQVTVLPTP